MLKHLAETRCMHEEDYAELIRMNADMLVLKHRVETRTRRLWAMAPPIPSYPAGRVTPPFSSVVVSNKYLLMEGTDKLNVIATSDNRFFLSAAATGQCPHVRVHGLQPTGMTGHCDMCLT
jgi:hypothetical protein